jgi:hypothetical protein
MFVRHELMLDVSFAAARARLVKAAAGGGGAVDAQHRR